MKSKTIHWMPAKMIGSNTVQCNRFLHHLENGTSDTTKVTCKRCLIHIGRR